MIANPKPRPQGACAVSFYGQQRSQLKAEDWAKLKKAPRNTLCSLQVEPEATQEAAERHFDGRYVGHRVLGSGRAGQGLYIGAPPKSIAMNLPSWVKLLGRNDVIKIE